MDGYCLACLAVTPIRSTRGARLADHTCRCGGPLTGAANGIGATVHAARRGDQVAVAAAAAARAGHGEPARWFGIISDAYPDCWGGIRWPPEARCQTTPVLLLLGWTQRGPSARPTHCTVAAAKLACAEHATIEANDLLERPSRWARGLRLVAVTFWPLPAGALERARDGRSDQPDLLGGDPVGDPIGDPTGNPTGNPGPLPATIARPLPAPVALALRRTGDHDRLEVTLHGRTFRLITLRDSRRGRVSGYSVVEVSAPGSEWQQRRAEGSRRECREWLEAVARGEQPDPGLPTDFKPSRTPTQPAPPVAVRDDHASGDPAGADLR